MVNKIKMKELLEEGQERLDDQEENGVSRMDLWKNSSVILKILIEMNK